MWRDAALQWYTITTDIVSYSSYITDSIQLQQQKKEKLLFAYYFSDLWLMEYMADVIPVEKEFVPLDAAELRSRIAGYAMFPFYRETYIWRIPDEVLVENVFTLPTDEKVVALTFDDGPVAFTVDLLDYLTSNEIPATFFLVCENMNSENMTWFDRELFAIAPHSYDHTSMDVQSPEQLVADFAWCYGRFEKYGIDATLFRPPYGTINARSVSQASLHGWRSIIRDVDSLDRDGYEWERLIRHVVDNVQPWSIVLFHDGVDLRSLAQIVDELREQGYRFVRVDEYI